MTNDEARLRMRMVAYLHHTDRCNLVGFAIEHPDLLLLPLCECGALAVMFEAMKLSGPTERTTQ